MPDLLSATAVAFGVVFLAELGDKTQLLALGFGARYSLRQVALGLFIGYGIANIVAVVVGGVLGATFPDRPVEIIGGAIFLVFAVTTWLDDDDEADDAEHDGEESGGEDGRRSSAAGEPRRSPRWVGSTAVTAIGFSILVAEMGDKTQLANATLAAGSSPVGVWIGGTVGATASGMIGAFAGTMLGDRIAPDRLRLAAAALFAVFGVLMLAGVF